ncbi:MAG: hypothetical protein ACIAZJ_27690 [Gimesia chilikensis]|uniref:hypothetical protein n=1 Tax=Gimesia chilikensis TaxID=2605989 RepID=UPI0037A4E57B
MSARNAKRIWNSCLLLAMTSVPLTVEAADKQPEKPAADTAPVMAVKPIPEQGPTPLPEALKFARLDADKSAAQTAAQFQVVKTVSDKYGVVDREIKQLQEQIKTTAAQIKADQATLKQVKQAEAKQQQLKGADPLVAPKPLPDNAALSRQIAAREAQIKTWDASVKEKQKQLGALKKEVAEAKKQHSLLQAKEKEFQEIVKLYEGKQPAADPSLFREMAAYQNSRPLYSCKIDASGNYLLAGAQGSAFHRWDLVSAENTELLGHNSWVRRFDVDRSRPLLITGAYEGKIAWWNLDSKSPKPQHLVDAHKGFVRGVSVSPDGKLVATAGNDRLVKIWSVDTAKLIRTLEGHEHQVYNVKFHPSGRYLISGDLRGNVKQWDVESGKLVRDFDGSAIYKYDKTFHGHIGGVRGMDISHDGKYFAISGIGEVSNAFAGIGVPTVILFDWETGKRLAVMTPSDNFKGTCWGVRFHPENDFIAAVGGNSSGMIWFWKLGEEKPFVSQKVKSVPYDLAFHPDGLRMCVACYDKTARLYNLGPKTPEELASEQKKKKK